MVRGGKVVSPVSVVVACCSDTWISVGRSLAQLRNGTVSYPVWFPGGCSVATTQFCGWFPMGGHVWLAIVVFEVAWVSCFVESLVVLSKLYWSVKVSGGCCQTTSKIGGSIGILVDSGLSHAAPEWKRGVSSLTFGLQPERSLLNCFGHLFVGLESVLPAVQSWEVVCSLHLLQNNISQWNG